MLGENTTPPITRILLKRPPPPELHRLAVKIPRFKSRKGVGDFFFSFRSNYDYDSFFIIEFLKSRIRKIIKFSKLDFCLNVTDVAESNRRRGGYWNICLEIFRARQIIKSTLINNGAVAIERQTAFWRRANSSGIPYSSRAPLSPATLSRARPIPAANFEKLTVSRRPIYFNAGRDYRCSIPLLAISSHGH